MALAVCALFGCPMSAETEVTSGVKNGVEASTGAEGKVVHITKADFLAKVFNYEKSPNQWVYEGDKPCIVDFYADWCGPCKMLSPIVDEVAKEMSEIKVVKVNVDEAQDLAMNYQVMSIPTLVVIKNGKEAKRSVGLIDKSEIKNLVK